MRLSLRWALVAPIFAGCGGQPGLDGSDAGDGGASKDVSVDATRDGAVDGISDASEDTSTDVPGDAATDSSAGYASDGATARTYLVDPAHTSSVAGTHVKPPLARAWTAKLGGAVSYPLVVNGVVYVTTNGARMTAASPAVDAQLVALDATTGSNVWHLDLGPISAATIAYEDGRVFAMDDTSLLSSAAPRLRAYDAATGALDWTAAPDNQGFFDPPPVAYRGIVYVYGSGVGGTVYAYDETSGAMLWRANTGGGEGSPAVSDDGVFIAEGCQNVYGFDRVSGASRWTHKGPCAGGGGATPLIDGQSLYVRDEMGDLVLDVATGSPVANPFVSSVAPALDGANLFEVASTMRATDAASGRIVWTFAGDGRLATSPLVADGYVYVGSSTANLFALREADGAPVWLENTGVPLVSSEVFTMEPRVALAAGDGLLFVPVGSSLFAYASAGPADGGLPDAATEAGCSWSMTPVPPSPTTPGPNGLAIGDLNHDGRLDLVIPHEDDGLGGVDSAGVLLGNGDGTFGAETLYPTDPGAGSYSAALGDFNGDGNLDVVVANPYSGYTGPYIVSVFLGKGDGTLQPRVDYTTGKFPFAVAVADLNGDTVLDVAVLAEGLNVLLGKGDGTFQAGASYPTTTGGFAIALADVDADGKVDTVVADQSDGVVVRLGNGDGTFQPAVAYALSSSPSSVAVDDLNGDGKKDVAATGNDGTVSVLLGAGDGTFQLKGAFPTGVSPTSVGIADLNRDGHADLAVTNAGAATVSILLGNGDGTFQPQFVYGTGSGPRSIGIIDLNGDGWLDLAIDDQLDYAVSVFLGGCR